MKPIGTSCEECVETYGIYDQEPPCEGCFPTTHPRNNDDSDMKTIYLLQDCGYEGCQPLCAFDTLVQAERMRTECEEYEKVRPKPVRPNTHDDKVLEKFQQDVIEWEKQHPLYCFDTPPSIIEDYDIVEVKLLTTQDNPA